MILNIRKLASMVKLGLSLLLGALLPFNLALACAFHGNIGAQLNNMDQSYVVLANIVQARKEGLLDDKPKSEQMVMFLFKQKLFETGYDGELAYLQAIEGHISTFRSSNGFSYQDDNEQPLAMLTTEMDVLYNLINNRFSWSQVEKMEVATITGNDTVQADRIRDVLNEAFPSVETL